MVFYAVSSRKTTSYQIHPIMFYVQRSLLTLLSILLALSLFANDGDWQLVKESNDIQVYTKKIDGFSLKAYKGETVVRTSIDIVKATIKDIPSQDQWVLDCKESKILESISENEYITYTVTDAPWPVTDRDSVMRVTVSEEADGKVVFTLKAEPDYIPIQDGKTRVPHFEGSWTLIPQDNQTKVIYEGLADPGGQIPGWLANTKIVDNPYHSLLNLKKRVE